MFVFMHRYWQCNNMCRDFKVDDHLVFHDLIGDNAFPPVLSSVKSAPPPVCSDAMYIAWASFCTVQYCTKYVYLNR